MGDPDARVLQFSIHVRDAAAPPSTISRPDAPYCLSGYRYSREHTCDQWEINSYLREIEDYTDKLRKFAQAAATFADEAGRFSSDAVAYAVRERDQVMSEIE